MYTLVCRGLNLQFKELETSELNVTLIGSASSRISVSAYDAWQNQYQTEGLSSRCGDTIALFTGPVGTSSLLSTYGGCCKLCRALYTSSNPCYLTEHLVQRNRSVAEANKSYDRCQPAENPTETSAHSDHTISQFSRRGRAISRPHQRVLVLLVPHLLYTRLSSSLRLKPSLTEHRRCGSHRHTRSSQSPGDASLINISKNSYPR
mmetsp:Transcript_5910/g.24942  ORF Transcript_5910/g.24942 Transcript_5910/m.24942 type:complete len:205 (-) Transcript_5910:69-683(-)